MTTLLNMTIAQVQGLVDFQLEKFGRIGGGLYDELDHYGFYIEEINSQYIVRKK